MIQIEHQCGQTLRKSKTNCDHRFAPTCRQSNKQHACAFDANRTMFTYTPSCARTSHRTIPTQCPPIDSPVKQPADAHQPSLMPTHPPFIHSPARPFYRTHSPTHPPKHALSTNNFYNDLRHVNFCPPSPTIFNDI